jgi:DNA-binding transcriptional LysR family regulator
MLHSGGLNPNFVAEAETIDAMLKLVSSGIGDCILPSQIPDKLLRDYGLRKLKIKHPILHRRMVLIKHAERPLSTLALLLEQSIVALAGELSKNNVE